MKKIVLFAVLCSVILLLMPMVSSVETRLVEDEIEDKYNNINLLFTKFKENSIFDVFNLKLLIFLWLAYGLSSFIFELILYGTPFDFNELISMGLTFFMIHFLAIITSTGDFQNSFIVLIWDIIGIYIFNIIENISPNLLGYSFGLIVYSVILTILFYIFTSDVDISSQF